MNEKTLLLISFIGSLAGLLGLFFLSQHLDYGEQTIEKINTERIQDIVKIEGEVSHVSKGENITFILVKQPSMMDVIIFGKNITLYEGDRVEIIGKGEEYNGKMEIIAQRIRRIS